MAAFESLVRAHEDIAFRVAYLITRSAEAAEEAAQDGAVKAYRALHRFDEGAPFRPWLLRIVANEAKNGVRAAVRRSQAELRLAGIAPQQGRPTEEEVLAAQDRSLLLEAVQRLPESQRRAVALRFFAELTIAETAVALGVRTGTVKSRVARALDRLRADLGDDGI